MSSARKMVKRAPVAVFSRLKRVRIPGAHGANVYGIGAAFFKSIKSIRLAERAAAISFNFLMAIPPSLIFLVSLVPFLPLDTAQETILSSIRMLSPNPRLFATVESIITDFMNNKRRELLSFGFLFTIFLSSNGVMGILRSFDRDSPGHIRRTGMVRRWKAIRLTLGLMLVFLISIALIIIQTSLLDRYLVNLLGSTMIIKLFSWITLVGIIYITICILYKYGPSLQHQFRFFSTGAFIATALFVIITYGFFFVANHFINYNRVYGSIGTLLMFMAWMFITGLVILIGYEINLAILLQTGKIPLEAPPEGHEAPKE
ncbi:YihY/virulence factor BrkB family protein [Taibaiella koreensis]|uniref:YihY/virulence factor BrkB family protein n=1 Tax=Taibaiella koreensis TaxID=1268548 RepID=UPI000E59E673|nr:YihY/virulence factor BrkB family protein [Taibaiella koreensis]